MPLPAGPPSAPVTRSPVASSSWSAIFHTFLEDESFIVAVVSVAIKDQRLTLFALGVFTEVLGRQEGKVAKAQKGRIANTEGVGFVRKYSVM